MLDLFIALAPIASVVILSEYLWRTKKLKGEAVRKLAHISSGCYIAFWPNIIPMNQIMWIGAMALAASVVSRTLNVFTSVNTVQRRTYGDLFFAAAVAVCAGVASSEHIFSAAMLIMALPDGLAAVVGRKWGESNGYQVFGNENLKKSVAGTVTYLAVTYAILTIAWSLSALPTGGSLLFYWLVLPFALAATENIMPYGLDNLATPLLATLLLNSLV